MRGRRRRAAPGHVRRGERGGVREGSLHLLRETAGGIGRAERSSSQGSEVKLVPERDRGESPLSKATAQGPYRDGHAQTDQVSPSV